jgi:hypothetical protein
MKARGSAPGEPGKPPLSPERAESSILMMKPFQGFISIELLQPGALPLAFI